MDKGKTIRNWFSATSQSRRFCLFAFWLLLSWSRLGAGNGIEPAFACNLSALRHLADFQPLTGNTFALEAMRPVINRGEVPFVKVGEPYTVSRSYDSPTWGLTSYVPRVRFGSYKVFQERHAGILGDLEKDYSKQFDPEMMDWLKKDFDEELNHPSERNILYTIRSRWKPEVYGDYGAYLRLFDGSFVNGESALLPLERDTHWRAPERHLLSGPDYGLVELGRAKRNSAVEMRDLDYLNALFSEAAAYLDVRFVQRKLPSKVRVIAPRVQSRLYQRTYGFEVEVSPEQLEALWRRKGVLELMQKKKMTGLSILQMDGKDFVEKFKSKWPKWQFHSYYMNHRDLPAETFADPNLDLPKLIETWHKIYRGQDLPFDVMLHPKQYRKEVRNVMKHFQKFHKKAKKGEPPVWGMSRHPEKPDYYGPVPDFETFVRDHSRHAPKLLF